MNRGSRPDSCTSAVADAATAPECGRRRGIWMQFFCIVKNLSLLRPDDLNLLIIKIN